MYKTTLNKAQQEAVTSTEGPVLILAGAGAGKTKTITHRILALIEKGVPPEAILAVTFTNKAAAEMRERTMALVGEHARSHFPVPPTGTPTVSTFHALGVTLLRNHAGAMGLKRHFTIYDRSDSVRAVKAAIIEAGFDPKQFAPRSVLSAISKHKGDGRTCAQLEERVGNEFYPRLVADVWARYERTLAQEGVLDFDDLLLKTAELLTRNEDIARRYQERWRYVHVDEYQDTNKVQYKIARILTNTHRNLCCVGDIDQNIYAWRGADIENILSFERHYPEAKIILLEQNYRSTKTIVAASNDIIKRNTRRRDKTVFTENDDGEKISVFVAYDEADEATFVARTARERIEAGVPAHEIAVLYRANFQSRILEEAFLAEQIPYQVLGVRFFDRKEVKDILSYIRCALAQNNADLARIINEPTRGIGKVTLTKVLAGETEQLPAATRKKVEAFFAILTTIRLSAESESPSKVVRTAITESGLEAQLARGGEEEQERLENLKELVTLATRYDAFPKEEALSKFLDDAALASDQDELKETVSAVRLMTVHASKGLEFGTVFITGMEEGLFPHDKQDEKADDEEERRLFYVALTRAKEKVYLSYANVRTIYGSRQVNLPSQFITDIDPEYLEAHQRDEASPGRVIYLD